MRRFIVEACIATLIALVFCYMGAGWAGVLGGLLGCVLGAAFLIRDYRRNHPHVK